MAKFIINSINYASSGEERSFVNMDIELGYESEDRIHLLCTENSTEVSGDIVTEQRGGYYISRKFIHDENANLSHLSAITIYGQKYSSILHEDKGTFVEDGTENRKNIRLYLSCCSDTIEESMKNFLKESSRNNCTFVLDNCQNDKNNITCNGIIVNNCYDLRDVSIKKQGIHSSVNEDLYNTDLRHDIYAPGLGTDPVGFCQTNDTSEYYNDTLIVTDPTTVSPSELVTNLDQNEYQYADYGYTTRIRSKNLDTYTYATKKYREELGMTIKDSFVYRRDYLGVDKQFIVDMPVDSFRADSSKCDSATDYDGGDMYFTRLHQTKSLYNANYSMDMNSVSAINNCRTYCGIGQCGGRPYLKYYDNVDYTTISSDDTEDLQKLYVNKKTQNLVPFQKIESLYPSDYTSKGNHKSNLFTITIDNTGIPSIKDSYKKDVLKKDITNAVKEIVNNVAPANTQLFDVYFD